ncbi:MULTISPECIES: sporulation peptidase YabG [Metabacillus]|jgi:spore coat assemly protein|uniref:Sporulation peptidase YabG n=1 Tax=Metabacillus rhizolycopersici TaxID=2875709 RepID=A0ABS7US75_9BACI|nr:MULTISPECIES: sporulation peptidase YabG [Metabacillus]MBZ5751160.1 sporulation peptidase YabG [Metabacillus rhizolycopersici]MCM3655027.1 sporulation peptidase YabG [Metabacillus litoralis]
MQVKIGDIVARKSYRLDLLFRVIDVKITATGEQVAILYGDEVRLVADAKCDDLVVVDEKERNSRKQKEKEKVDQSYYLLTQDYQLQREKQEYYATSSYSHNEEFFHIPGRVLHVDGDPHYLQKCLSLYEKIGVPVDGVHVSEKEMPEKITELLDKYRPDILVVTGHDAYSKHKGSIDDLNAYRHSKQFVQTVLNARNKVSHLDQLVIFAGACQSHFESLIRAGANFASSPSRVNIHALDPVYIVAKVSFTPFIERINVWDVLRNTLTREKGLGGVDTKGVLRTGMPYKNHSNQ